MAVSGNTIAHENLVDQNAVDWRRQFQSTLGYDFVAAAGVGSGGVARSGDCAVTQRGAGANMSVDVAAGFVAAGPNSGGTGYDATAGVWTGYNDATLNVVISAADATNPRIDLIGFGIRDTAYAGATDDGQITVITGTPAGVPAAPSVPATYIAWVTIAEVAVAALAASITNANITDRRRRLSSLGGITVCTSSTRPATNLWEGQTIYETDTDRLLAYDGSTWGPAGAHLSTASVAQFQHQVASGSSDAGTFTSGAWRTRPLNTTVRNTITGASLAANQVVLPAGDYWLDASALGADVDQHTVKWYNITDAADVRIGMVVRAEAASTTPSHPSHVRGFFTIAASKTFELQHQCTSTKATDGMGIRGTFGVVEVYADVVIWQVGT